MTVGGTSGTTSIDGLVSGLNTTQIISQLMQVEAMPQTQLKIRVASEQMLVSAYQSINAKFAALQTAADALVGDSTWNAVGVSSTSSNVTATASAGASPGTFSFDVTQVAQAASTMSTSTYAMTDPVTSSLSITKGGTTTSVNVGDGTLASVINGINGDASLGLQAVAVQVSSGQYKLQITAKDTGAASNFTVSGLSVDASGGTTTNGKDATIMVGTTQISRSTNTFSDVLPGVSFTVSKVENGDTLTMSPDADGIAGKVQSLVDAANTALDEIAKYASYDPDKKLGGPLTGDFTVRELQQQVLDAVTTAVGGGTATDAGVAVDKTGHLTFDPAKFKSYFASNPTAARALLDNSTSFTPSTSLAGTVKVLTTADSAQEGSFDLNVTQAATQSTTTFNADAMADGSMTFTVNGQTKQIALDPLGTSTRAADLAAAITSAGLGLMATDDGSGNVTVVSAAYGKSSNFAATDTTGASVAVTQGTDVQVSVNGTTYSGTGQTVNVNGIGLLVTLTAADVTGLGGTPAGSVSVSRGVATRLAHISWGATDVVSGSITSAIAGATSQIDDLNSQISDWDVRLQMKQQMLQSQYSALEVALGKLKDQSNWLAGQLSSLPTASGNG